MIGLMCYTFTRVSAMVHMKVEDYYQNGKRWWIRLHEKGGKRHDVPAHHNAQDYLDAYLDVAGIWDEKKSSLFRSVDKSGHVGTQEKSRQSAPKYRFHSEDIPKTGSSACPQ